LHFTTKKKKLKINIKKKLRRKTYDKEEEEILFINYPKGNIHNLP
jgi:hypothetical protein